MLIKPYKVYQIVTNAPLFCTNMAIKGEIVMEETSNYNKQEPRPHYTRILLKGTPWL